MNSKLIEKFFRKECTPEEVEKVLTWFSQQRATPMHENVLHAFWKEAEIDKDDPRFAHDPHELLGLIHEQMPQSDIAPSARNKKFKRLSDSWAYALRVAAIILFPFLFTWLFLNFSQSKQTTEPVAMATIETPAGTKRISVLPDGSKVMLNARSAITYDAGFDGHKREITLVGEAFFEVAKDSLRPFVVHAGNLSTTALGTSFNINYQQGSAETKVSLATGVVQIHTYKTAKMKETELQPGEQLTYTTKDHAFHTDYFDTLETLGWKEGVLYFKKASIEQVVQKIEDWYGVKITLAGNTSKVKSQDWHYSGMFENQNLENVLTGISYVKNFSFEMTEKNITLIFN